MVLLTHKIAALQSSRAGVSPSGNAEFAPARQSRGFTLMELMIAVAILIVIILSVGITFSGASKSVGLSQATMELMNGVRATQQMMERDFAGLDRNGFLVIRCRMFNPAVPESGRFDQVSFISYGNFPHRGGTSAGSFADTTVANAANVWWGQLILEKQIGNANNTSFFQSDETRVSQASLLPTGVIPGPNAQNPVALTKESDSAFGRHATLLIPAPVTSNTITINGTTMYAYDTLDGATSTGPTIGNDNGVKAHISSSRHDVVAQSPAQVMQWLATKRTTNPDVFFGGTGPVPELQLIMYRFRALSSIYDIESTIANSTAAINPFAAGYFRLTPVVMPAVSSFKVEWTDGTVWPQPTIDASGRNISGQLVWFGPNRLHRNIAIDQIPGTPDPAMELSPGVDSDQYDAVFSYFNKSSWPKALRFTLHVASDRLAGGRDFVQVIDLPQ